MHDGISESAARELTRHYAAGVAFQRGRAWAERWMGIALREYQQDGSRVPDASRRVALDAYEDYRSAHRLPERDGHPAAFVRGFLSIWRSEHDGYASMTEGAYPW